MCVLFTSYCYSLCTEACDAKTHSLFVQTCSTINVFSCSDASKIPVESDTDEDGAPRISLAEMLEDLSLSDATGGDGADMMTDE